MTTTLTSSDFAAAHLELGRPVLARGALSGGAALPWNLADLARRFGGHRVPVYDSLFALQSVSTFSRYVERYTGTGPTAAKPYLRWYTRQSRQLLPWADKAFAELAAEWAMPAWLPRTDYVFPRTAGPVDVTVDPFPAKGLFVCGRGGRTRLHVDPWASDACLCQVTGTKRLVMFRPEAGEVLSREGDVVDLDEPDESRFPRWHEAKPEFDEILRPGDAAFIPAGWYHAAVALSDSVSITWNFVHATHEDRFGRYLLACGRTDPTVDYFLSAVD